jgi:tetratricopeptide (TPR) repeat protein
VTDHPSREVLRRFALGDLGAAEADAIAVHLRGCARCRAEAESHLALMLAQAAAGTAPADPGQEPLDAYDRAIDAAAAAVRLHGTAAVQVRKRTHQILAGLRAGDTPELPPPSAVSTSARPPRRFPLFDAALRCSWELRHENPGRMIELATFATRLAPSLGEDGYTPAQVADFQARAWGELGNAYRIGDEPARAEEALAAAFEHLARGTRDELLEARLLSLHASLLGSRSRFRATLEALSRLRAIHERRGDVHNAGRALIQAAFYLAYWGMSEVALRTVDEGMAMIDAELDPNLHAQALQNRLDLLVDCRRFQEAREQLRQHRTRLLTDSSLVNRLRIKTIEGRLEVGLGNLERAARAFRMARRRFLKAGYRRQATLAALELAAVRMRQGRFDEAKPLIAEAVEILVAIDAAGEAATALKLLQACREMATVTPAQVQTVADVLRRSNRSDPGGS